MEENKTGKKTTKKEHMAELFGLQKDDVKYVLVITVVKRGFGYEVVKTATANGASGAVILDGRGVSREKRKLFGFDIAPEKDLVMMAVAEESSYSIVKSIYAIADFRSVAKGVVFALPIEAFLK